MQRAPASYAAVAPAEDAPHDKLHFFRRHVPSFDWCVLYRLEWLAADLSCGVTLGFVLVAQSLAHAALCGVAAIRGPYSCVLAPVLYALLGSSFKRSNASGWDKRNRINGWQTRSPTGERFMSSRCSARLSGKRWESLSGWATSH